jgi:hypothetical protein
MYETKVKQDVQDLNERKLADYQTKRLCMLQEDSKVVEKEWSPRSLRLCRVSGFWRLRLRRRETGGPTSTGPLYATAHYRSLVLLKDK